MPSRRPPWPWLLGLLLVLTPGRPCPADGPPPGLREKVDRLVDQLKGTDGVKAGHAEGGLIDLGPEVLPLLPPGKTGLTADQARRLAAVRATLQDLAPRTVTLDRKAVRLADALRELRRQTGIGVTDQRREPSNPEIALHLTRVPFWQALDAIARQARVAYSLYQDGGRIALVDGPFRELPVSYSGVFRTTVKRVEAARDLESGTHSCVVDLEVAWEPRFRPFFVDQGPASVSYRDAGGKDLTRAQGGRGETPVEGRPSLEFSVRIPAPARPVARLGLLRGGLRVVTPSKMLTFTFDPLAKIETRAQARVREKDGVTVRLVRLRPADDPWDAELALAYPPGGPRFESYQSWLVNNEAYLENRKTHARVRPPQGGEQVNRSAYPHADVVYYFDNKNGRLGRPESWKLVYRTPGRIVSLPARFEFQDLPLP